jgi:lipopolysaccharide/colanic/teichoic acid biosynthesis glycosyltransferase
VGSSAQGPPCGVLLVHSVAQLEAPVAEDREVPESWHLVKRVTDIVVGVLLLLLALPVIALASLAIICVAGGKPFYAQERIGMSGRRFKMFKLRTMVNGAHEMREEVMHLNECDGPVFKIRNDPRLHPLGSFLRSTSVDELPNLINVVAGDMSLVGPPGVAVRGGALRLVRAPSPDRAARPDMPLADQRPQPRVVRRVDVSRQSLRRYLDALERSTDHRQDDPRCPPKGRRPLGSASGSFDSPRARRITSR